MIHEIILKRFFKEPKNNNSNKKETNKIEDEEKNIKNKDHQKLNKKKTRTK